MSDMILSLIIVPVQGINLPSIIELRKAERDHGELKFTCAVELGSDPSGFGLNTTCVVPVKVKSLIIQNNLQVQFFGSYHYEGHPRPITVIGQYCLRPQGGRISLVKMPE